MRRTPPRRRADLARTGPLHRRLHADPIWSSVRVGVFARAGGDCERCGARLTSLWQGHHRKLRSAGGQDSASNALALDRRCHRWVHHHPGEAVLAGWIVPAHADPARVPVRLHDGRLVLLVADGTYADAPREQATALTAAGAILQPAGVASHRAVFVADLANFNAALRKADAVATADDGFEYVVAEKVPPQLLSAYAALVQHGYATGVLR